VIDVENRSLTSQITQLDIRVPEIAVAYSAESRLYWGYRGGSRSRPGLDKWVQGNTGFWPGYCTSPVVTLWDEKTGQTLAVTFFNDRLLEAAMYWFSGPSGEGDAKRQAINLFLRLQGPLEPLESVSLPVEISELSGGATEHWAHYRKDILQPFMARMGFPESATFQAGGKWAFETDAGRGLTNKVFQLVRKAGIEGYVAWPYPDGQSFLFDSHLVSAPFFSEFLATSQLAGLKHLGTLVIPDASPRVFNDMALGQMIEVQGKKVPSKFANLFLNQRADVTRQYNLLYARILRDHGITIAYYDTGGGPHYSRPPLDWLRTYADYKRAGIAVMGETGGDVSAWISGVWFEYPYSWNDYTMLPQLLPGAAFFAMAQDDHSKDDGKGPEKWWDNARRKGITPVIRANYAGA
jgi:hypothetical protein